MENSDIITTDRVSNVCECGMSHYVIKGDNNYVVSENPIWNLQLVLCHFI